MVTDPPPPPPAGLASSRVLQRVILSLLKCLKCVRGERSMVETGGVWGGGGYGKNLQSVCCHSEWAHRSRQGTGSLSSPSEDLVKVPGSPRLTLLRFHVLRRAGRSLPLISRRRDCLHTLFLMKETATMKGGASGPPCSSSAHSLPLKGPDGRFTV